MFLRPPESILYAGFCETACTYLFYLKRQKVFPLDHYEEFNLTVATMLLTAVRQSICYGADFTKEYYNGITYETLLGYCLSTDWLALSCTKRLRFPGFVEVCRVLGACYSKMRIIESDLDIIRIGDNMLSCLRDHMYCGDMEIDHRMSRPQMRECYQSFLGTENLRAKMRDKCAAFRIALAGYGYNFVPEIPFEAYDQRKSMQSEKPTEGQDAAASHKVDTGVGNKDDTKGQTDRFLIRASNFLEYLIVIVIVVGIIAFVCR